MKTLKVTLITYRGWFFSNTWKGISSALDLRVVSCTQVGIDKGTSDDEVWELCQNQHCFLLTDNRTQSTADSLESIIRTRNTVTSLPVFTISDMKRFRSEPQYVDALVERLLEYLLEADSIRGAGRLYLP
jgi:hypothetical protein